MRLLNVIKCFHKKIVNSSVVLKSFATIGLRLLGIFILLFYTCFLTQNYDPKIIGQLDFIRTYLLVFGTLGLLGVEQSILYYAGFLKVNGTIGNLKAVFFDKIKIIFCTSAFLMAIVVSIGSEKVNLFFDDNLSYDLIFESTACLFFYNLSTFNAETLRALDKSFLSEIFRNILRNLLPFIAAVFLFYSGQEVLLIRFVLLSFVFLSIISFAVVIYVFSQENSNPVEIESKVSKVEIIKKSFPMAVSGLSFFLIMSFDVFLLRKYYGDETIAYYATAIKIITVISMLVLSVNISLTTEVAECFEQKDFSRLKKVTKNGSRLIFMITLPISIFVVVFSDFVLCIFGESYKVASTALVVLVIGIASGALFGVNFIYLNMTGRQKVFRNILVIAVCVNLILNSILVKKFGMTGAAISFAASTLLWNLLSALYIYRKDGLKIFLH